MTQEVSLFHPSRRAYRFSVLLFVSLLTYGSYFAYDSLGAIAPMLIEALGVDRAAVGATYTVYSIAAIVSVFLGGLLIDKIGTRKASLIFSSLVVLGTIIVAIAPSLWLLYVGRFIFGAGSESLVVAQSAIIARWFKGKELALAFGIALTISRLGTLFSFNTEALIASFFGKYQYALWAAVLFCVVSLLSNLIYNILDKRGEHALDLKEEGAGDKIVLSDIKKFKSSYWYVTLLCVTFYSAIFPFTALSTDFFHDKWGLPMEAGGSGGFLSQVFSNLIHMFTTAGGTTSIIIFASMVFAPFAGSLVDKIGRRASLMMIGSILMIPSYIIMGYTTVNPAIPMIILGAAFVLVPAAMWPAVPLIVQKERVGTAFGLMTMIQNIGLATFPWLNGLLRDFTHTYKASMLMFASLGAFGLLFAVLLLRADRREGGKLENPHG
ncbi:MAG TPA: MFS transporter [Thermoanaerobaculia bacterium]|nr:MFS transporter [Thermoanaerobaculia bacterium]HUM30354.1 MFS transporter [Thermoanaerobaculia bacterium]HXK68495.1 MFS transporter [Thermoanaerobaculia bacterium]